MKLIAIRDFSNNCGLDIDDAVHDKHVHKGAIFSIGGDAPFEKCNKQDQLLIAQLNVANCVGDANNKETVAAVQRELDSEKKKAERAKAPAPAK